MMQLDGISPATKASLLATLNPTSTSQFTMTSGSVTASGGAIQVNLTPTSSSTSVAAGVFETGITSPVTISRVEVELAVHFFVAVQAEAMVGGLGINYAMGDPKGPPKRDRVYSFSNSGLGQDILGSGVSHSAPDSVSTLPLYFRHQVEGPWTTGFASITQIRVYGEWWWG